MSYQIIFMIGGPGSGKGTQCKNFIKNHPSYYHIELGALVRDPSKNNSSEKKMLAEGKLLSNQSMLNLIRQEMAKLPDATGFLIDGYLRNVERIKLFENIITDDYIVIYFDISEKLMRERVLSRKQDRFDDNEETLTERITVYNDTIKIILNYLQMKNKLFKIDASLDADRIAEHIDHIITNKKSFLRPSHL